MTTSETQQTPTMQAEPRQEHRWLHKLVGEWTCEMGEPDKPAETSTSTERVRSIGDLWIMAEGEVEMPGGGVAATFMTLGYDPRRQRYVGTWLGSMMTHLWVYQGELDAAERVLTLNAEGPSMEREGKLAQYQDIIEFKSDDHRVLTSRMLGDDGQWHHFMTAHYRRKR
jgi:hypothetical protein